MTVVSFSPRNKFPSGWRSAEVQELLTGCATSLSSGEVSGWESGETETGDPQLYLLGPAPDYECVFCVSRLSGLYVLEDGNGAILLEHRNLGVLSQRLRAFLSRRRLMICAKAAIVWVALRQTIEEKIEPLLAEPMEVATHFAPQLAALA